MVGRRNRTGGSVWNCYSGKRLMLPGKGRVGQGEIYHMPACRAIRCGDGDAPRERGG